MKKRRRIFSVVLAAIFLLCLAACQQKEPKMKDGKILLTVCVESLRWFAQCWERHYHGEFHSLHCPVLYG